MLIDRETEQRLLAILQAVTSSYATYMIGRQLGQSIGAATTSAIGIASAGKLTFLESAYLAGKAATEIGVDALRKMSERDLVTWLQDNNIRVTPQDRVYINQLKDNTERWLQGRTAAWQQKVRTEISRADQMWRSALAAERFVDAPALNIARNQAMVNLVARIEDNSADWTGDIDRLIQSEMNAYFQSGQVADMEGEAFVYKVPRPNACQYCLELTTNPDGSPILYRLVDVMGNTNVGMPAYAWEFTVGPIHPYCYCVLYEVSDRDPEAVEALAEARSNLNKSIRPRTNSCGMPANPELLFENQKGKAHGRPEHVDVMISALRKAYGDHLPGS